MKKLFFLFLILISSIFSSQNMKPLADLIYSNDDTWQLLLKEIHSAKNSVEILPADSLKAREALFNTQVTTRSAMGSVAFHTGGILVDSGWIRIIASGNEKLKRTLPEWNKEKSFEEYGQPSTFLLIADDVLGGFFLLNGGTLGNDFGKVYYFSPDNLEFEPLDLAYNEFLDFCFNGNLELFYKDFRWKDWKKDIEKVSGDQAYNFYPYLWSKEGKDLKKVSKSIVPIEEIYEQNMSFRKQFGLSK